MFSPKQKELFKKRLEGLPLTKTEQEYYSRSVKKKVVALANADLHGLARKLLEKKSCSLVVNRKGGQLAAFLIEIRGVSIVSPYHGCHEFPLFLF